MPTVSGGAVAAARVRLQDNLKLGLTCVKELWHYEVKDWVTSVHAADINQDGDIEVLAGSRDGRVCALTRGGHQRWERVIGDKKLVTAIAAYSPLSEQHEACVVTSTRAGKIYVLDKQGNELAPPGLEETGPTYWVNVHQAITHMWLDPTLPLTVVYAAEDHCAYSFDVAHNRLRWRFPIDDQIRALYVADIDGDGRAETLIGSENKQLYVLSSTGKLLDTCKMEQAIFTLYAVDLEGNGQVDILVGTRTKKLFALTANLQRKWVQQLSSRPLAISVADVNNDRQPEILVACDDQSLSILDTMGKPIWRQPLGKRYSSLNTFDLDLDGHIEVLAGADDSQVYALRIQLTRDLDKKIRRDYAILGKPDITTLLDLTKEQLDLLLGLLGSTYGNIDKKLNVALARGQMENGHFVEALLSLQKLDQQKFQLLWEKDQMGYRRALCLADLLGDKRREVVVSSLDGGLSVFNARGRLLWSEKSSDGGRIFDAQSGYLYNGHGEDLAFASDSGSISLMNSDKTKPAIPFQFPEPAACFYLLASTPQSASEILMGTKSGKVYLYTNHFDTPARIFDLPATVQRVYASEPDKDGRYRNPELLMSTAENQLFAYTRGGNHLWTYPARSRILALCVKDLDGDGRLEVLIGTEDRNIYVLDDNGNLRWRYVLYHGVLALETADIDNNGKQEILAGCQDGVLYVFTSDGDLIWRYVSKDPIQALRVDDIDLDGNVEIVMVEENHLEVLQVVNQQELNVLIAECWEHLLPAREPLDALLPLIKGSDPYLRAAALAKMAALDPLPAAAFDLLGDAMNDSFTHVRKNLPEAVMHAYPTDPLRARPQLASLFIERTRDVRIEVVEHLEILARHDWQTVLFYLERALNSDERNTRRAVLRKISRLLSDFAEEIRESQHTLGEDLFNLLLIGATDATAPYATSIWVKQEAGRVLADFLNLFEDEFLPYLYRLFSNRLDLDVLKHTAYNLASPTIQQAVVSLLTLNFEFDPTSAQGMVARAAETFNVLSKPGSAYSTDLWLIYRELLKLYNLASIEDLSVYDFHLRQEQFQTTSVPYPHAQKFLHAGDQLNAIMRPLKTYLRRSDPNDRLSSLLESISALEVFQRVIDREYEVSPLPGVPQPALPELVVLKGLIARWQALFSSLRNSLRGHPEMKCDLQSRTVHLEETIGIWLQITNLGRASAFNVKVTLLSDKSFVAERPTQSQPFEIDAFLPNQDVGLEFLIKPLTDAVTLTFEVAYDDAEHESHTFLYQERLNFIERPQTFLFIENPYTTGTPLPDSRMCYGREDSLDYLQDNLTRTTAQSVLVLFGQRRSGKTTLLNQLAKTDMLAEHIPVLVDMQKLAYGLTLGKFFFGLAYAIFRALEKKGLSVPEPQRRDFVDPLEDPLFLFERFLDKVELCRGRCKLILLLDEFEELEENVKAGSLKPDVFKLLRSLMQERYYIQFLLSGTHQLEKLTRNYWSVFFNIAHHYRLPSRISPEGAENLIVQPVAGFLEYEPQVVNKIRKLTADQPYMIHLLCRNLVNHCNKMQKNYATINDVNLVLQETLTTGTNQFDWLWERFEDDHRLLLQIIAYGGKDEGHPLDLDDMKRLYQQYHHPYTQKVLMEALKRLWAEDVIEANNAEQTDGVSENARYSIPNGLLRRWLRLEKPLKALQPVEEPTASASDQESVALPVLEQSAPPAHQSNGIQKPSPTSA